MRTFRTMTLFFVSAAALMACRDDCGLEISCCTSCDQQSARRDSCGRCAADETPAYLCPSRSSCALSYYVREGPARCCAGNCQSLEIYQDPSKRCREQDSYLHQCALESNCFQSHQAKTIGAEYVPWRRQEAGTLVPLLGIWGDDAATVWAVGMHGRIVRGSGGVFVDEESPTSESLTGIWGSKEGRLWAVGRNGTLLERAISGGWSTVDIPVSENLQAIWGRAQDDVWAVGAAGTIVHYDGESWRIERVPADSGDLMAVHGNEQHVYALSKHAGLLQRTADGWDLEDPGFDGGVSALWLAADGVLWVGGLGGRSWRRAAGSRDWQSLDPITAASLVAIRGGAGSIWAVGTRGAILRAGNEGWQRISYAQSIVESDLYALWGDAEQIWTVGLGGIVLNYRR